MNTRKWIVLAWLLATVVIMAAKAGKRRDPISGSDIAFAIVEVAVIGWLVVTA